MLGDNVSVNGNQSNAAGRDVNVVNLVADRESLRNIFSDRIKDVDEYVNDLLPEGGMISPTAENKLQKFKCEDLIISLTKVGIPMRVGMDIAQGVGGHLSIIIQDASKVTTRHVREAVLQSIYCLKSRYAEPAVSRWADEYARRYGNPDERIKILELDGEEYDLSFQYLIDVLIPHLIKKITLHDLGVLNHCGIISRSDTRRMANNILDHIRGLNVYSIRYKTIFNLAFDLAVQPPHPWFSNPDDINQTIDYNIQRAIAHLEILKALGKPEDHGAAMHSLQETLNHLSSTLLAHYGLYLGVTQGLSGPFIQLIHSVKIAEESGNPALWKCCKIKQIEGDLIAAGSSFNEFRSLLKKLKIYAHKPSFDHEDLIAKCEKLHTIVRTIAIPENNPTAILSDLIYDACIQDSLIESAILGSLRHIPTLHYKNKQNNTGHFFDHNLAPPLGNFIYPKIFFYFTYSLQQLSLGEEVDDLISSISKVVDSEPMCNLAIIVARSGFAHDLIQECKRISKTGPYRLCCLDSADLLYILNENDRSAAFNYTLTK